MGTAKNPWLAKGFTHGGGVAPFLRGKKMAIVLHKNLGKIGFTRRWWYHEPQLFIRMIKYQFDNGKTIRVIVE